MSNLFDQMKQGLHRLMGQSDKCNSPNQDANDVHDESIFQSMIRKLRELQTATGYRANRIAEALAEQISLWTGKKTTAEQVKKGAKTGALIGGVMAMFLVAKEMSQNATTQNNTTAGFPCDPTGSNPADYPLASNQQSDEDYFEQIRIEEDHLDYINREDQNQYFDQSYDLAQEQISYNEGLDMF